MAKDAIDYAQLYDEIEQEAKAGAGLFGRVKFEIGYKVYVAGLGNEDSFFAFTDQETKEAAKSAALKVGNPRPAYRLRLYKDQTKGRTAERAAGDGERPGWKEDRHFVDGTWTRVWAEDIRPFLEENGITPGDEFWARLSFVEDKDGRTEKDQYDEERNKLVAVLTDVYASEAEIDEAAGETAATEAETSTASGGVPKAFRKAILDEYNALVGNGEKPIAAAKSVAEEYEQSLEDVMALLDE